MNLETELILDYKEHGNIESFEKLFKMTKGWLYRMIMRIVPDKDEADEVFQQCWIKVLSNINDFDNDRGSFNNYLFTISKHLALKWKNKISKFDNNVEEVLLSKELLRVDSDYYDIAERNQMLKFAISKLEIHYQDVILLHYFSELDIKEVAKLLDKPDGTIKTWLSRARTRLKDELIHSEFKTYLVSRDVLFQIIMILAIIFC